MTDPTGPAKPASDGAISKFISSVKNTVVNSTYYQGTIGLLQEDATIATKEMPAKAQQLGGGEPAQAAPAQVQSKPAAPKTPGR